MQMADEPEARELLRRALAAVLGSPPPVRFQLGLGAVRPETGKPVKPAPVEEHREAADAPPADDEPLPEYYEMGAGFEEPGIGTRVAPSSAPADQTSPAAAPQSDLERLLVQDLGAKIVAEHSNGENLADEGGTDEGLGEVVQPKMEELGLLDPDMLEEDD